MARFVTSDGLKLHYEDSGTGQPLLCLPGLTRNTRDFDFLAPHMSHLRFMAMDYRGRGQSDLAPDFTSYSVPREAQDVADLLDYLELDKVTLLGTSRGGLIAMALTAGYPDRVAGVILNDVGPVVSADGVARIMEYAGLTPQAKTLDAITDAIRTALEPQFPGLPQSVWLAKAAAQYRQTDAGLALRYDPRLRDALLAQIEAGPPPDLWPQFDSLAGRPLGVLRGANSDILAPATLTQMQARNPDLIAMTVPDRGHLPLLDEPESLALIHRILKDTA